MPVPDTPPTSYQVSVLREAVRILDRLDRPTKRRLAAAIDQMATNPFAGDVRAVAGEPDAYRRRVGGWRILFRIDQPTRIVTVYRIGPRGDVYGA